MSCYVVSSCFELCFVIYVLHSFDSEETSVTNNSLSQDYPHPDNHAKQITDIPELKPFTMICYVMLHGVVLYCNLPLCRVELG